ncbi:hypothetical protein [Methanoplanus endosymbiosus]|uniref:Uncharacterized protein n=1 Tax=Methanoplanus endosymbiosus TaxID=33865 RepID=A0A9E7TL84_9EURY|nr:hypothetical protein [Methanoplanus endosymbiosus]UUX93554.1 hypothetical protein L6E24_05410 [Methanoplanus endosymbiosus]
MNIIEEAVKKLEENIFGSGCDDGVAAVSIKTDGRICPFSTGKCLGSTYGGKSVYMTTEYPFEVKTKISFMYNSELNNCLKRAAACALVNSMTNFMCFIRLSSPCDEGMESECLCKLKEIIGDKKVFLNGNMPFLKEKLISQVVASPEESDLIIISPDGIISDSGIEITDRFRDEKEMLFTGPGTAGICNILNLNHFCPFGRR